MPTRIITTSASRIECFIPTIKDVESLAVGDSAPYVMGIGEVSEIFARGEDCNGRPYVCYYVSTSSSSRMSASMKVGEVVRTLALCNALSSAQIDEVERLAIA